MKTESLAAAVGGGGGTESAMGSTLDCFDQTTSRIELIKYQICGIDTT